MKIPTKCHNNEAKLPGAPKEGEMGIFFIELELNDTSTVVCHFVSSPRERKKRDIRDSRGEERDGKGRKRNRNES